MALRDCQPEVILASSCHGSLPFISDVPIPGPQFNWDTPDFEILCPLPQLDVRSTVRYTDGEPRFDVDIRTIEESSCFRYEASLTLELRGPQGGTVSDWIFARVVSSPIMEDRPPSGVDGEDWLPPRLAYHTYFVVPVYYDQPTGEWLDDPTRPSGTAYRAPSSQWPPTGIITGQVVMVRECRTADGMYEMTPWGSVKNYVETFTTRIVPLCWNGVPYFAHFQRSRRIFGRDLCIASATSTDS